MTDTYLLLYSLSW